MAIDQNMKEVLKFNRSYMAKTHYSKSDLEQIARVYQMCKRSHTEPEMRDLYNTRFAMIVEEASKMIKAFSSERMSVDADALNLMQDFIEEFGREYVRDGKELHYEYTPEATRAKLVIQKNRHNFEKAEKTTAAQKAKSKIIVHPATAEKLAEKVRTAAGKSETLMKKLVNALSFKKRAKAAVAGKHKNMYKKAPARQHFECSASRQQSKKRVMLKLQKTSQMRVAFLRGIKNSVSNTAAETKNYIGQNIRRYGMAAVALWGVSGTTGLTNVNAHAEHYSAASSVVRDLSKFEFPDEAAAAMERMRPAKDTLDLAPMFEQTAALPNLGSFQSSLDLSLPWMVGETQTDEEETEPKTVADISYADYYFSGEELAAMGESKIGSELSEQALKVAGNMNCEGYCYRGVKRMFRRTNLGEMYGRSAYMARKYMDENLNFKQIRCDFNDLDKLPSGSVVIFDRGQKSHRHGHIFVVGRDKQGRAKDFSSKIRNVRRTLNGYGGYYVYVPADTPVPGQVQEKIEQIMVLNHPVKDKKSETENNWMYQIQFQANNGRTAI